MGLNKYYLDNWNRRQYPKFTDFMEARCERLKEAYVRERIQRQGDSQGFEQITDVRLLCEGSEDHQGDTRPSGEPQREILFLGDQEEQVRGPQEEGKDCLAEVQCQPNYQEQWLFEDRLP